jgi:hypothetical protein
MNKPFSQKFKDGFWKSLYEYLLISLPVAIYVILEALHKNDIIVLFVSPEWAIVTIFLAFVSLSKYLSSIAKSGKSIFEPIIGIISLFILLIVIAAIVNAKISMDAESNGAICFRLFLFLLTSIFFFVFMTGAQLLGKE